MGDDPRRLCPALMNEVAQLPIVVLDIGLTCPNRLSLEPEHAHVKSNLPLLCQLVGTTRILGQEDADDADSSGEPHGIRQGYSSSDWVSPCRPTCGIDSPHIHSLGRHPLRASALTLDPRGRLSSRRSECSRSWLLKQACQDGDRQP